MEIENKLDEDFLFYLGFTTSFFHRLPDKADVEKCQAWLQKLCGEPCNGIDQKRSRNIFLSNLVLCMQEGKLSEPFSESPNEVSISDASKFFGAVKVEVQPPAWLDDLVQGGASDGENKEEKQIRDDGRTYVATRAMPGGEGSFAYVAVTLADEEPKWLGGGEGIFEKHMQDKFAEYVPPPNEMEQILAKRKDPKERQRVIAFYDILIQNINDELDGEMTAEDNDTINGLLDQLINDLKSKGTYENYQQMTDKERRVELLIILHDRLTSRKEKVRKREEVLDNIEASMPKSFFDTSVSQQDRYELPSAMWEQAINKAPGRKNLENLQANYPTILNDKFLELLSNQKEEIAVRLQRRHDNIVSQMRKELRKEGEALRKWVEEARVSCEQAMDVLKAIREARKKQLEEEIKMSQRKKGGETEKTALYEQMRAALCDQQLNVEEEAERGRELTQQINSINAQTEMYQQVTTESIMKTEEANMGIMKNIKRLQAAVKQHETRLGQIQAMAKTRSESTKASQQYFFA